MAVRKRMGDILIESGKISEEQLTEAISYQKKHYHKLGEALVELGYISKVEIIETLSMQLGHPIIEIFEEEVDLSIVKSIPRTLALKYNLIPIRKIGDKVLVVTSNPFEINGIHDVEFVTKMRAYIGLASDEDIKYAIERFYKAEVSQKEIEALDQAFQKEDVIDSLSDENIANAPTVRIVNTIINQSIKEGASDIHIEPFEKDVIVRIRKDGILSKLMNLPYSSYQAVSARFKVMAGMNIAESRIPQDGRIEIKNGNQTNDLRVSSLPTSFGEKIVLRILNREAGLMQRKDLGMTPLQNKIIDQFQQTPYGIVLVSGPTGSGKTTTLYTLLKELNSEDKNIVTVEDPVEYVLKGINQVHVNQKAGLTFAAGLRSILRQDPDIIMIGEIRDEATAEIAVRAAITGHMVLSTIHTNDSASSVTRLVDMGVPAYLVADALVGVVAQRLVRRLCKDCKEAYETSAIDQTILKSPQTHTIYKPVGCKNCAQTGYKGRAAIHEILQLNDAMKETIANGTTSLHLREMAMKEGMTSLFDACQKLVIDGVTSIDEMKRTVFS